MSDNEPRDPFAELATASAKFWKVLVVDPLMPFVRWVAKRPEWQLWSVVAVSWMVFGIFLTLAVAHQ